MIKNLSAGSGESSIGEETDQSQGDTNLPSREAGAEETRRQLKRKNRFTLFAAAAGLVVLMLVVGVLVYLSARKKLIRQA